MVRRKKRDELQPTILRVMRNGGMRGQRYIQPWTIGDLMRRTPIAHLIGKDVEKLERALIQLEERRDIIRLPGLPVAYRLEP